MIAFVTYEDMEALDGRLKLVEGKLIAITNQLNKLIAELKAERKK
jgi:hypothetical protein